MRSVDLVRRMLDAKRVPELDECDVCVLPAVLWNDHGEQSCGAHQAWLARVR